MSRVFRNIDRPEGVPPPPTKAGGTLHTLRAERGGGGRGINILEDARHRIGL